MSRARSSATPGTQAATAVARLGEAGTRRSPPPLCDVYAPLVLRPSDEMTRVPAIRPSHTEAKSRLGIHMAADVVSRPSRAFSFLTE